MWNSLAVLAAAGPFLLCGRCADALWIGKGLDQPFLKSDV